MSIHGIGTLDFEFWDGPAPKFAGSVIESSQRPGTDGTFQVNLGRKGSPFEVTLRHPFPSYLAAVDAGKVWNDLLLGAGPQTVKYNNINYQNRYSHLYSVDNVIDHGAYAAIWLAGPGYTYSNGGMAVITLQLLPHYIG